jgi:hypothetical protein
MQLWFVVFAGFEALIFLEGVLAYRAGRFSVSQIEGKGIPFLMHGGMWSDVFIISPLCATFVASYSNLWSAPAVLFALIAGIAGSIAMHILYEKESYPDALVMGHRLTSSGWGHFFYMAGAFAVIGLFYVDTSGIQLAMVWSVTALLIAHIAVGNHFLLGLIAPHWCKVKPLRSVTGWVTVLGCAALLIALSFIKLGGV